MFHEVKGNNISFDKKRQTASWNPVQSGGLAFTNIPLSPTQPVILKVEGTGAVELGVISNDPDLLRDQIPDSSNKLRNYLFLNDVKIHKRTCTMEIKLNSDKREILSSYGGGHYKQEVDCVKTYWLVTDVKYGQVDMKLNNNDTQHDRYEFSNICGNNIRRLNDACCVSSQRKSPASFCFYHEPLCQRKQYIVRCTPRQYQGTVPGRYYLSLYYTTSKPEEFRDNNVARFDVLQRENVQSPREEDLIKVEKFEKEECTGNPILIKYVDGRLEYKSSTGKRSNQQVRTSSSDFWFVFELYGVSATVNVIDDVVDGARTCDVTGSDVISPIMADIQEENAEASNVATSIPVVHPDTATPRPDSCGMDDPVFLQNAIQKNFTHLRDTFCVDEFIDYMFEQKMLTQQQLTEFTNLCEHKNHQATKKVLMRLSAGPVSKKFMINALEKTNQNHLIKYFFADEEKE